MLLKVCCTIKNTRTSKSITISFDTAKKEFGRAAEQAKPRSRKHPTKSLIQIFFFSSINYGQVRTLITSYHNNFVIYSRSRLPFWRIFQLLLTGIHNLRCDKLQAFHRWRFRHCRWSCEALWCQNYSYNL